MPSCAICNSNTLGHGARACLFCHRTWHTTCAVPHQRILDCSCEAYLELDANGTPHHCIAKGCMAPTSTQSWLCEGCTKTTARRFETFVLQQPTIWYPSATHLSRAFLQSTATFLDITARDKHNPLVVAATQLLLTALKNNKTRFATKATGEVAHAFKVALAEMEQSGRRYTLPLQSHQFKCCLDNSLLAPFKRFLRDTRSAVFIGSSAVQCSNTIAITDADSLVSVLQSKGYTGLKLDFIVAQYKDAMHDVLALEKEKRLWLDGTRTVVVWRKNTTSRIPGLADVYKKTHCTPPAK
jgi:hypothetical protein